MRNRSEYYGYGDGRRFQGLNLRETFYQINKNQHWIIDPQHNSISGPGSTEEQTKEIVKQLPKILDTYQIKKVLDIPCGDFNWIKQVDWSGRQYIGADIVNEVIQKNIDQHQTNLISFEVLDLTSDTLPSVDLIFCRDCLVHLSFEDIYQALSNIKRSGCRYLMTTTFPNEEINEDIFSGGWRPINLCIRPFKFPDPVFLLNEQCTEGNGIFADKSLGLWKINYLL